MLRRTEKSDINSAALESIEQGIDQLARAYPYADADYLHERTRSGLHYVTKQLEFRMTLRQHRELLVDTGWLFLLNACVQYDRANAEPRTSARVLHSVSAKSPATVRSRRGRGRSRRGCPDSESLAGHA
ncbi:hypothetical protein [Streptomyces sp. WAC 04229]|uniref:hypothetical protein n=1 Tax=Streptomyces sp. WAC 04229 TaxID=2203206 RepID=UPI0021AD757D|nr:hypothetical protein [Streptomyces sp. WAC 04229]